jgi:protein tyrosine phosphatase (PTP) superfamily phosphohydrolase (DUF442 family)
VTGEMRATRDAFERILDVEAPHYEDSIEPALREVELYEKAVETARVIFRHDPVRSHMGRLDDLRSALAALDAAKGEKT